MKLLSKILLVVYLLTLAWLILFKFSTDLSSLTDYQTGLNLIPFAGEPKLGEMISNFVVFIPLGLLLGVNFKQTSLWRKFAFVLCFSISAELIQLVFSIGTADITDVITNSYGGFLGLLLYSLLRKRVDERKLDKAIVTTVAILLVTALGILFAGKARFQSTPESDVIQSQTILAEDAQLAWPVTGQAAVGTVENGLVARSSNSEKPRPMASMAKVVTALAIMEKQPLELGDSGTVYTLTDEDVAIYYQYVTQDGSVLPVYKGMRLTQYQAMQMMLIASANNMADTLVERTFGSQEAYAAYAQDMLQRMGLSRTVVADASGFSSDTVSTPSELVAIGIAALKNPVIAKIVSQPKADIQGIGIIRNTNELLGIDGVIGLKTGTTDSAGSCLLFAARYANGQGGEVTIVGVIMGAKNADSVFADSEKLLASARQGFGLSQSQTAEDDITSQQTPRDRPSRQ